MRSRSLTCGIAACLPFVAADPMARAGDCPADLDGNGSIGFADLNTMLADWGGSGASGGDLTGDENVGFEDLSILLGAWGPCPPAVAPDLFGHYVGDALVTDSPYHQPGTYPAEALIAQTASGFVGYLNVTFDPGDLLGGTVTHTFSGPLPVPGALELKYSDRICGAGDPIGYCYPHAGQPFVQYSFAGAATIDGDTLTLGAPAVIAGLPYAATLPFESATMTRRTNRLRDGFDGPYGNLEYIWMGTAIFPLPLPLFGNNAVSISGGEITSWTTNGFPVAIAGIDPDPVIVDWCFDDAQGRGWMNQQGEWFYDWILDPDGAGVAVIVTFAGAAGVPDCAAFGDPLAGAGLDAVHLDLVGIMLELAP